MDIQVFDNYYVGHNTYCREKIHSEFFPFLGFEDFFISNFGKKNQFVINVLENRINHRIEKFQAIETAHRNASVDGFVNIIRNLNLKMIFGNINQKNILKSLDLIFSQWENFAIDNNINIEEEKNEFTLLKKSFVEDLKKTKDIKDIIDTLIFKAASTSTFFDDSHSLENKCKDMLTYINENISVLTYESLENIAKTGYFGLSDYGSKFSLLTDSILNKTRLNNPYALQSYAELYKETLEKANGDIGNFFVDKLKETIHENIEMTQSQKNKSAIYFLDSSFLFVEKDGNLYIPKTSSELKNKISETYNDLIDYKLRKQPKFSKIFQQKFKEDHNIFHAISAIDSFIKNYDILKNVGIPNDFFDKSFEAIDDYITNTSKKYKVTKFANSILSSKYKNLYNESAYPFFEKFYDEKLKPEFIQTYIGKKLAMLKNPEDFTAFVKKVHDGLFMFGKELTEINLNKHNKEALIINDDIAIIEIKSFEESKAFGTNNWCISRSSNYFDDYTDDECRQYFIFDFTKDAEDSYSMIGITLNLDGTIKAAHKKDDDNIKNENVSQSLSLKILSLQIDEYKENMSPYLLEKIDNYIEKNKDKKTFLKVS